MTAGDSFQKHCDEGIWQRVTMETQWLYSLQTVMSLAQACRHYSWTVLFPLHAPSVSYNHECHCETCYYRLRWVTTIWLVTPYNSPVIQLEINVCVPQRHFSLISFPWWWRELLFHWHFNSSSADKNTKLIHLFFSVKFRILTCYLIEERSMIQQTWGEFSCPHCFTMFSIFMWYLRT